MEIVDVFMAFDDGGGSSYFEVPVELPDDKLIEYIFGDDIDHLVYVDILRNDNECRWTFRPSRWHIEK
jgi:hypothetical protein